MRIDHLACEQKLERAPAADETRKALRSSIAGNQAELDFGLPELGFVTRDAHVTRHREFTAATEREPIHRGDHGFGR